jgi:hypothetical protein
MTTAYTSLLGLALPVDGELTGTWGQVVNNSITSLLDTAVAGAATTSVASADWTLSTTSGAANEARAAILRPTGSPGVLRNIIAPSQSKAYIVQNQSNAAVVVKGSATTGVSIAAGKTALVAWNGSDFIEITPSTISSTLPVALGGTNSTATPTAGGAGYGTGTAHAYTAAGTAGQVLTSQGAAAPTWTTLTSSGGTVTSVSGTGTVSGLTLSGTVTSSGSLTLGGSITGFVATGGALGTPSSGTLSSCTVDGTDAVGFRNIPINSQSAAYTAVLADSGKCIFHPSTDANARTFTIPANGSVAYPIGTAISFVNMTAQVVSIAITTDTMYLAGTGTTGTRSLAQYGTATALKMTSTTWIISGAGLT